MSIGSSIAAILTDDRLERGRGQEGKVPLSGLAVPTLASGLTTDDRLLTPQLTLLLSNYLEHRFLDLFSQPYL